MATQSNSGELPQMTFSMDLITDLINSVNGLRESVTQLRNENNGLQISVSHLERDNHKLRQTITILQRSTGVLFPLFSKLPAELRQIIWQYACRAPPIHILKSSHASRSSINSIVNSCQEARAAAAALQLDYFVFSGRNLISTEILADTTKNYMKLDIDTIWVSVVGRFSHIPRDINMKCGRCQAAGVDFCHNEGHFIHGQAEPKLVRKFAINYSAWLENKEGEGDLEDLLDNLSRFRILDLLIVVGDSEHIGAETDIVFVTPPQRPIDTVNSMSLAEREDLWAFSVTWQKLEKEARLMLQEFKADYLREHAKSEDSDSTSEEYEDEICANLKAWEVPKVRFVQPMMASSKWVYPPPEKWAW